MRLPRRLLDPAFWGLAFTIGSGVGMIAAAGFSIHLFLLFIESLGFG